MKKAVLILITCIFALALLCGCDASDNGGQVGDSGDEIISTDDKNLHGEVNELLTVEELGDFHLNGAKYPENFVFDKLQGYGRVIGSSASGEEALSVAEKRFTNSDYKVVENRITVETDLFYGLYVKWAHRSEKYSYDEYVVSFKKSVYDAENNRFITKDKDEIKSIIDYMYYSRSYNTSGFKVYSADISLEEDKYEYTAYLLIEIGGDWGMQDELAFLKTKCYIDLTTGIMTYDYKRVGTAYIDGQFTHSGGVVEE